jgi:hypothetical protein
MISCAPDHTIIDTTGKAESIELVGGWERCTFVTIDLTQVIILQTR